MILSRIHLNTKRSRVRSRGFERGRGSQGVAPAARRGSGLGGLGVCEAAVEQIVDGDVGHVGGERGFRQGLGDIRDVGLAGQHLHHLAHGRARGGFRMRA